MRKKREKLKRFAIYITVTILIFSLIITLLYFRVRPIIITAAKSNAETIMLNASSRAMQNILQNDNITYNGISRITRQDNGQITGIEIDIRQINLLKNSLSSEVSKIIAQKEFYNVIIPFGTLTSTEYLNGFGPRIKFPMQFTSTVIVDYKSNFISAGINQVLHQILITIRLNGNLLILGNTENFSVSTTEIAAQTVIVGVTPDTFTSVVETPTDDIADEIFNYAVLE